jgi:predicted hotdog family 3-hydroxylacyl-ACP dehydratase
MLVSEDKILQLIPQRRPMVMIDCLVSCDDLQVVSQLTILPDNLFLDENGMTASGLMETMAQTAAARTGWLIQNQPGLENKKVPVGVIGSIKNFRLYFQPETGSVLETTVTIEHEVMLATVVKGKVVSNGKLAAESEMQIFLTENQ